MHEQFLEAQYMGSMLIELHGNVQFSVLWGAIKVYKPCKSALFLVILLTAQLTRSLAAKLYGKATKRAYIFSQKIFPHNLHLLSVPFDWFCVQVVRSHSAQWHLAQRKYKIHIKVIFVYILVLFCPVRPFREYNTEKKKI